MPYCLAHFKFMDILNFHIITKSLYFENPVVCYCPIKNLFGTTGAQCPFDTNGMYEGPRGLYVSVSKNDSNLIYLYAEGIKRTYITSLGQPIDTSQSWVSEILRLVYWLSLSEGIRGFNLYLSSDPAFRPEDFLYSIGLGYASGLALINLFKLQVSPEELKKELIKMKFSPDVFPVGGLGL
jgi:hypothetical protein